MVTSATSERIFSVLKTAAYLRSTMTEITAYLHVHVHKDITNAINFAKEFFTCKVEHFGSF